MIDRRDLSISSFEFASLSLLAVDDCYDEAKIYEVDMEDWRWFRCQG